MDLNLVFGIFLVPQLVREQRLCHKMANILFLFQQRLWHILCLFWNIPSCASEEPLYQSDIKSARPYFEAACMKLRFNPREAEKQYAEHVDIRAAGAAETRGRDVHRVRPGCCFEMLLLNLRRQQWEIMVPLWAPTAPRYTATGHMSARFPVGSPGWSNAINRLHTSGDLNLPR